MTSPLVLLARRLERAQALQNERMNQLAGGQSLAVGGGFAHRRGPRHPLNQALGLVAPLSEEELVGVEEFLGAPTVLELSPGADEALWPLLARRGYRLHQLQQLWARPLREPLAEGAPSPGVEVAPATPEEEEQYNRVVAAGFFDRDDWRAHEAPFRTPLAARDVWGFVARVDGEPAGGGLLGLVEGVALLSGDGVLPRFRGRGLQRVLIRARLEAARARGADVACAGTLPGTASQRSYEACGFRAAYPKVEMARG